MRIVWSKKYIYQSEWCDKMKEIIGKFKKHVKTLHLTGVILINSKSVKNVRNKINKRKI